MITRAFFAVALLATVPVARPVAAQSMPLVGKWHLEYERGRRMENGESTPIMGTGEITIAQSGDSLLATLQPGPRPDGSAAPPATFGGRLAGDEATFVQKVKATININGEERVQELTITWKLSATGDALTGTMSRVLPMMPDAPMASPVKGTRTR